MCRAGVVLNVPSRPDRTGPTARGRSPHSCGTRTATLEEPLDLSAYDGIYIDAALVSDEDVARRAWKCTIRTGASRGEVVHSAEWTPSVGEGGAPCRVPFEDFKLVRGPRLVEGAPPLNASACEKVYGFGLTLSKFGAARPGATPVVENFRDGPFAVKLNGVGCYGAAAAVAAAPKRLAVGGSKPNSPGSPIKTNGIILGVALALLRPIASLVFSEEGRRRAQARKQLVQGGKAKNGWAARRYGQRVIKSGVKGLGPVAAAAEGLREFAKDSAAYFRRVDIPRTGRGDAAAETWIFRGDRSRRHRGRDVDIPWRPARASGTSRGAPRATAS